MKQAFPLIAAAALALTLAACGESDTDTDTDTGTTTIATETTAEATETTTEADEADQSEQAQAAEYEAWLKDQFGVQSFTQVLVDDPSSWAGYINGVEANRDRMHVRLQVDRDDPADNAMGERASTALASLVRLSDDPRVSGVKWVVVDDGSGVVISQESV